MLFFCCAVFSVVMAKHAAFAAAFNRKLQVMFVKLTLGFFASHQAKTFYRVITVNHKMKEANMYLPHLTHVPNNKTFWVSLSSTPSRKITYYQEQTKQMRFLLPLSAAPSSPQALPCPSHIPCGTWHIPALPPGTPLHPENTGLRYTVELGPHCLDYQSCLCHVFFPVVHQVFHG